jgi:hypothetical protein
MPPLLWLALAAPPTPLTVPDLPRVPPEVAQRLLDPPRCLQPRCVHGEWVVEALPDIPRGQRRAGADNLPGGTTRLRVPGVARDWVKPQGNNARVGVQYGMQVVQTPSTSVRVAVDTGFRLKRFADDGIGTTGPILRGQLEWNQVLGQRVRLIQSARVETGQRGAYLRNSLLLNVQLQPVLTLISGIELQRDRDLPGRDRTDATLKLKYAF